MTEASELAIRDQARRPRFTQARAEGLERAVDVIVALVGLIVLSPVLIIVAIAIRLDSRGPVVYRQLRIGIDRRDAGPPDPETASRRTTDLGGRPFTIYKFRTMTADAERDTGPVWAAPEDSRVTRVGRVLRRFRLDELPQLLNVLRGEMSVVGPRPERPMFVHQLRHEVENYQLRQRVRPGITGWAQVNQEPDQTVDDVRGKLQYDLEYLEKRSLRFDLEIILRTLPVMIQRVRRRS
ncbi:MAG: sugar transferase [Gemmatimonadota bacterium]|nr:sugar transferase [Gemmatimonadota bacterium]